MAVSLAVPLSSCCPKPTTVALSPKIAFYDCKIIGCYVKTFIYLLSSLDHPGAFVVDKQAEQTG